MNEVESLASEVGSLATCLRTPTLSPAEVEKQRARVEQSARALNASQATWGGFWGKLVGVNPAVLLLALQILRLVLELVREIRNSRQQPQPPTVGG